MSDSLKKISDSLKKMSNSLIRSFLVSYLSDLLTIAHFLWATWANFSWSLIFGERPERIAHIAHFWWATWANHSHPSPKKWKLKNLLIFWIIFFNRIHIKHTKNKILDFLPNFFERIAHSLISYEQPERIAHSCSFVLTDLSDLLTVAHFLWATWVICSKSLICLERSERITHLIWAK